MRKLRDLKVATLRWKLLQALLLLSGMKFCRLHQKRGHLKMLVKLMMAMANRT
uniref:Candidate secreted effector n=1 Tax=Meloidogyne incognita TaxID=6306 RepID=A0A914M1E1_MELIC